MLMLFLLLSLFFLDSIDLCASQALEGLDCLDKIVNISKIVESWYFDHEVSCICNYFIEAGVYFWSLRGCKVYLMGKIVLGVNNHCSQGIYLVNACTFG